MWWKTQVVEDKGYEKHGIRWQTRGVVENTPKYDFFLTKMKNLNFVILKLQ